MEKLVGGFVGAANYMVWLWQYLEPTIWLAGLLGAAIFYLRKLVRVRRFKKEIHEDGRMIILVNNLGQAVEAAVTAQIGPPDLVIGVKDLLTDPADFKPIVSEIQKILVSATGEVHVIVAGPLSLAFIIGQMVGRYTWKIIFHQYTGGRYIKIDTWKIF